MADLTMEHRAAEDAAVRAAGTDAERVVILRAALARARARADLAAELVADAGELVEAAVEFFRASTHDQTAPEWASIVARMHEVKTAMATLVSHGGPGDSRTHVLPSDVDLRDRGLDDMIPLVEKHRHARLSLNLRLGLLRARALHT